MIFLYDYFLSSCLTPLFGTNGCKMRYARFLLAALSGAIVAAAQGAEKMVVQAADVPEQSVPILGGTAQWRGVGFPIYKVLTATDGSEAVDTFRQYSGNVHLVLCDLFMPCLDGWDTLAAMRKISPNLPFILSSGYGATRAMAGQQSEPIQGFLSKPMFYTICATPWLAC